MQKDDLIILLIALLLLAGMLITIFFGAEKSLHGVGASINGKPSPRVSLQKTLLIDLGQGLGCCKHVRLLHGISPYNQS